MKIFCIKTFYLTTFFAYFDIIFFQTLFRKLTDSHLDNESLSWRVDIDSSAPERISRCVATHLTLRGDGAESDATRALAQELFEHPVLVHF